MKRFISITFFLCLLLSMQAQEVYTTKNIPKVHLQNKTKYVCNPAGILSTAACDSIDRMLYALEQQTGIETVVAVVPSIGEEDCFDFAHRLLNEWGVGKKGKNNGLVILLVTDQRCIQFYTGYGLEGDLPDAICKRIQTRYMIPYLKDGNWNAGMIAGVSAVCSRLDGSMENDTEEGDDDSLGLIIAGFFGIFLIALIVGIMAQRAATKCPNCGQHKLQRTGSTLVSRRKGVKTEKVTYTCRNCGHKVVREQQSYDENYRGGGGSGPVIFGGGGLFGGSGGGGGFSGGSFGGGMGGGGGAGSRF
ncbi:TPM domain-containing protein [Bacteroides sp.]|uniref:TPM domain-containing protein n=1 Tax=Bacteroides sp. TaxID=29523 RepID=UPI003AB55C8B